MKKLIFIGLGSVVASIYIIFQIYQTSDIEPLDALVENTVKLLGVKVDAVERKIERKIEIERIELEKEADKLKVYIPGALDAETTDFTLDSIDNLANNDSIVNALASSEAEEKAIIQKRNEDLLAAKEAAVRKREAEALAVIEKAKSDSINLATINKKKNPFSATIIKTTSETTKNNNIVASGPKKFFPAKIHGNQRVEDNGIVMLRTSAPVTLNTKTYPVNTVFESKANIFDGKVIFVINSIVSQSISAKNYTDNQEGLPVNPEWKNGKYLILSDGFPLQIGY